MQNHPDLLCCPVAVAEHGLAELCQLLGASFALDSLMRCVAERRGHLPTITEQPLPHLRTCSVSAHAHGPDQIVLRPGLDPLRTLGAQLFGYAYLWQCGAADVTRSLWRGPTRSHPQQISTELLAMLLLARLEEVALPPYTIVEHHLLAQLLQLVPGVELRHGAAQHVRRYIEINDARDVIWSGVAEPFQSAEAELDYLLDRLDLWDDQRICLVGPYAPVPAAAQQLAYVSELARLVLQAAPRC